MFDTEAIDNVERYETIKENRDSLPHSMEKRVLQIKNIRKQHFRIVGNIMDFK